MDILFVLYFLILLTCTGVTYVQAIKDKTFQCSVCRALVSEMQWSISLINPKKKIQVGNFRVDGSGNQAGVYEVPYSRSEVHLVELVDEICPRMSKYAETIDDAGRQSIVRYESRGGEAMSLKSISISNEIQKKLQHICDGIMEDHEDEIINRFKKESSLEETEIDICLHNTELCSEEDLKIPMPDATLKDGEESDKGVDDNDGDDDDDEDDDEEDDDDDDEDDDSVGDDMVDDDVYFNKDDDIPDIDDYMKFTDDDNVVIPNPQREDGSRAMEGDIDDEDHKPKEEL